jgi:hypothetical protein
MLGPLSAEVNEKADELKIESRSMEISTRPLAMSPIIQQKIVL